MKKIFYTIIMFTCLVSFAADDQSIQPSSNPQAISDSAAAQNHLDPNKDYIDRGKYVTGGILASTVGFGIGHAVQGRFASKGWIFTSAEITGLALLSRGNCFRGRDSNSQDRAVRERSDCEYPADGIMGAGLLIGFHVWEILDAWIKAKPIPTQNTAEVFILPKNDGASLSLAIGF